MTLKFLIKLSGVKVHLTPKFVFRFYESTCYSKHLGEKIFNLVESLIFYALSKSRLKCFTTEF